jgi:hypothetical protein
MRIQNLKISNTNTTDIATTATLNILLISNLPYRQHKPLCNPQSAPLKIESFDYPSLIVDTEQIRPIGY